MTGADSMVMYGHILLRSTREIHAQEKSPRMDSDAVRGKIDRSLEMDASQFLLLKGCFRRDAFELCYEIDLSLKLQWILAGRPLDDSD